VERQAKQSKTTQHNPFRKAIKKQLKTTTTEIELIYDNHLQLFFICISYPVIRRKASVHGVPLGGDSHAARSLLPLYVTGPHNNRVLSGYLFAFNHPRSNQLLGFLFRTVAFFLLSGGDLKKLSNILVRLRGWCHTYTH